jgi:YhcH/YjgK/YiaL family protein
MREIVLNKNKQFSEKEQKRITAALFFLESNDLTSFPEGRIDIINDEVFAVFQSYQTAPANELLFEAHKDYIDLQYIISGAEKMLVAEISSLLHIQEPYNKEADIIFYKDPHIFNELILRSGDYTFFTPMDGHKTRCSTGQLQQEVKKVIIKILMES